MEAVEGSDIRCTVRNSGLLGERKSVNIPGASVPLPVMTDQDRADLVFGIDQDVDFVAASFVRNAEGVRELRRFLDATNSRRLPSCRWATSIRTQYFPTTCVRSLSPIARCGGPSRSPSTETSLRIASCMAW